MTVPMDSSLDVSPREHVQHLFKKNVELENRCRRSAQARLPSDPSVWQQMRENYEAIILEDHAFSEQHEIEYALWQLHYRRIEELRVHFSAALASNESATTQSGKGSARPDRITKFCSQFKTFLSDATGFYHDLMLKIRSKYGLPLGFFPDDPENQFIITKDGNKPTELTKGLISCHRCLIYLGDLSRYKGLYGEGASKTREFAAASNYYMQASSLWPSSGNPYHQLAILASYTEDELVSIYHYFRSLAVDIPFSTARDNLIIAFEKNRQKVSQFVVNAKASSTKNTPVRMTGKGRAKGGSMLALKVNKTSTNYVKERASSVPETFKAFSTWFVRLNGILFTRTSLETFGDIYSTVRNGLLELLTCEPEEKYNFGADAVENRLVIVRLIAILIFTVHNVNRETVNQTYADILQRSVLLQNAYTAVFDFMGIIIERCKQLHDPSMNFLLPGVLIFMEWLACHLDIAAGSEVEEKQAAARTFFWNNCISLLNKLLSSEPTSINQGKSETCFFNMIEYDEGETTYQLALWEDIELRGFLPLASAQLVLDFSNEPSGIDMKEEKARVQRIIAAGKALANVVRVGQQGMHFDPKRKKFTFGEQQISNDFVPDSSPDMPATNATGLGSPVDKRMNLGVPQPQFLEGEEEDEIIVFEPLVADRRSDGIAPKLSSYEDVHVVDVSKGDLVSCVESFLATPGSAFPQNGSEAIEREPTSLSPTAPHYLPSIQPSISKWLMDQQVSVELNNLNLVENAFVAKPVIQEKLEALQPGALSLPPAPSFNLFGMNGYSDPTSDPVIPSKFDSVTSLRGSFGSQSVKSSLTLPPNSRKNPISRPVRHAGPPPGFSTVSPIENVQMDDYSWLDGYQVSSSINAIRFNSSINHSAQPYKHVVKGDTSMEAIGFPFPGKQISTSHVSVENQRNWEDYQCSSNLELYQDRQQQYQKMNHLSIPLSDQYQGQSIREDCFFV